ncbi:MAG: hypothetical protein KIT89_04755 [Microcella sp.]|uniref:hypothetical protein n=1 Tax=Microcella sp. TaxID=1913979 RepID=UPI0024CDFFE2|nr:hypothetical protein [Microcella sp.]UYN84501.1 MAG: hypothetical protein KIT89_04755 [Microcella sp.]
MSEPDAVTAPDDALLSRLALIDERPLADRAEAYRHLHDELRTQLESADGDAGHSA